MAVPCAVVSEFPTFFVPTIVNFNTDSGGHAAAWTSTDRHAQAAQAARNRQRPRHNASHPPIL
eukprot:2698338-Prymnesium_polylepis.1